jgi:methionyl aminopeptidase
VFHRQTKPLVDYYSARSTFRRIDGNQPPDVVAERCRTRWSRPRGPPGDRLQVAGGDREDAGQQRPGGRRAGAPGDARRPGVTTLELDTEAEKLVRAAGAEPAFKGYRGFPNTLCVSVNEEVVHGIPSKRRAGRGGHHLHRHGREAERLLRRLGVTLPVGRISPEAARLLRVTEESLEKAIEQVRIGGRVSDIGHAIQQHVEAAGFSVVRSSWGTGSGPSLHEEPQIANYGAPGRGPRLAEGMTLAIEPMVNMGRDGREGALGRLDGRDEGRQPVGALRAHGGGGQGRPAGADGADGGAERIAGCSPRTIRGSRAGRRSRGPSWSSCRTGCTACARAAARGDGPCARRRRTQLRPGARRRPGAAGAVAPRRDARADRGSREEGLKAAWP